MTAHITKYIAKNQNLNGSKCIGGCSNSSRLGFGRFFIRRHSAVGIRVKVETGAAKRTFPPALVEIFASFLRQLRLIVFPGRRESCELVPNRNSIWGFVRPCVDVGHAEYAKIIYDWKVI